jgi:thiamine transport system ATP-binding protein
MTLELRDVTVRFGNTTAVDGVSLAVPVGQVLGLLGPSGSGKSTLLRAIAGLEPCAGEIRWDGASLAGVPAHRRGFALMFQDGQLFPHLDVAGNVGYALRIAGRPSSERVGELLDIVGLAGFERRRVTELSGGEQQRVALARSLAASPRVLLLDEPLSALDRELRDRLGTELREILVSTGTTAILVTHDHEEAATVADRIGIMDAGRLLQTGSLAELRADPANARVARFLGVADA